MRASISLLIKMRENMNCCPNSIGDSPSETSEPAWQVARQLPYLPLSALSLAEMGSATWSETSKSPQCAAYDNHMIAFSTTICFVYGQNIFRVLSLRKGPRWPPNILSPILDISKKKSNKMTTYFLLFLLPASNVISSSVEFSPQRYGFDFYWMWVCLAFPFQLCFLS